ncbi:MAG: hypothetical protein M3394_05500 [Actinomycetota bacterium]|nr:hypothetical protein [Actinomycetota bacterium]
MALDRRAADLVRGLDEHELRRLVILARGRLAALAGDGPQFGDEGGPKVSFRRQSVRCGKPTCTRCPHGPYWYACWREGDKVRTRYIGRTLDP